ncbi:MAG: DNA-directed RNA polymerase subunit alpha [Mycoplasmataceae bacterium]|nr:DNA-directed RNA polymerase subunit alpha [Mycoplasmataceae bacterium]
MEKFLKYTITPEVDTQNPQKATITVSPLEKGFGITLGNALRRTLLSNTPGASMFAIKIPGVTHEFQAMPGIKEDVTHIILNLKNLVITIDEAVVSDDELATTKIESWPVLKISKKGSGAIYASDIELPTGFRIINNDLYIATITNDKTKFELEIYATRGRGYKTFQQNHEAIQSLGIIPTDSNFSPIVRVGYHVEDHKISKTMTGDALILDVTTNGAISPQDAVAFAAKILAEHFNPLIEINAVIQQMQVIETTQKQTVANKLSTPIEDMNLSVRSYNCLKRRGIQTIEELVNMTRSEVEKIKNLGKKSLREIQKNLTEYGVSFKEE